MARNDPILTVAQMVAAEQALIDGGETIDSLMRRAGLGAAEWVWRLSGGRPVTVLCGPGNNGGDGYVIAQEIHRRGGEVSVIAPFSPNTDAARAACDAYAGPTGQKLAGGVFVDCLFGSGLARPLAEDMQALIHRLAADNPIRIAIDLPSGVAADEADVPGGWHPPLYDLTLALGAWKFAHWQAPARLLSRELRLVDIGIGPVEGAARLMSAPNIAAPDPLAYKYSRGLCSIIGGAMPGAGLLSAMAALRGGAGYVKLLAKKAPRNTPAELVVDTAPLGEALASRRANALVVGPGLGRTKSAQERLAAAVSSGIPAVFDADALHLLSPEQDCTGHIATPHHGELHVMCEAFGVNGPSHGAKAQALAEKSGMVIVAKGPDSCVAAPDGALMLAPPATAWLSTAGTGDVLAGLIGSRLATGASPFDAACQGLWLHGEAARRTPPPFTAAELAMHIPTAIGARL